MKVIHPQNTYMIYYYIYTARHHASHIYYVVYILIRKPRLLQNVVVCGVQWALLRHADNCTISVFGECSRVFSGAL